MGTINQAKQLAATDTPLLFFTCVLSSGDTQYWSSHGVTVNGQQYTARILKHNLFDLQLSADDAMDGISQLSIVLANADSLMSELNAAIGFKGAQLTVSFAFVNLPSGAATTETAVLFSGTAGDPDEITEDSLTLSFTNKLNLQRIPVPDVRIQRSCPWNFPATSAQRVEALTGGTSGRFSRFYRCGYSADVAGGVGNMNGPEAFTTCDKSRGNCTQRGMFSSDNAGNITQRFGGFEFVPTAYLVRTAGDKTSHLSPLIDNTAKYNDPVPMVYGTGWLQAPVIFARNDGNLTHMEVLLGLGEISAVLKVVVNDVEIPLVAASTDMSATGWYSPVSNGSRQGNFNLDFVDSSGNPQGDPHGSLAVLSVVVPNLISTGTSTPTVEVLMNGIQVDVYNPDGSFGATGFNNNPVWVILDVLQRAGWSPSEINIPSMAAAANFCQELIVATDLNGNSVNVARYACNLLVTKRQSAATVIRGIRVTACLMIRYGTTGLLELLTENTLALQQPNPPDGTNSSDPLAGGWPAYEFSDASGPFSGIVRSSTGASTVRLTSRSISESSNRLTVEFQDESNEYQQDCLSLVDSDDSDLIGFEVASTSTALGIPNFSQAYRVLLRQLNKSISGNLFVQFQTSFRALKVRPGDIIALTYLKEGFVRAPFRVQKLSPSLNYELVTIQAQTHNDEWYSDNAFLLGGAGRQPSSSVGVPLPLIGTAPHYDSSNNFEYFDFGVSDSITAQNDGSALDAISIAFSVPQQPTSNSMYLPLVSLSPSYASTGGTISSGAQYYYAVGASDATGAASPLSFTIPAVVPNSGANTNTVTLNSLSFPSQAVSFSVYRGTSPQLMYCIATNQAIAATFTDTGLPSPPIGPPDANFDHANFYYRYEFAGPFQADILSTNTIGWSNMGAVSGAYTGMVVRIIEGTGRGQERSILSNSQTTLTVNPAWGTAPDVTSVFVISQAAWQLAAVSSYSPAQFDIAYKSGAVVQITGRAANVSNQESNPALAPLTRWSLGGGASDIGLPAMPYCTLTAPGGGDLTVSAVGFNDLTNVAGVTSGTIQLFYWNELNTPSPYSLEPAVDAVSPVLTLASAGSPYLGQVIQVDQELMSILSFDQTNSTYTVVRGILNSTPAPHNAGAPLLHLDDSVIVMPFTPGFFENRASTNYIHTVSMPDVRISAAEFFATNSFGNGQSNQECYTQAQDAQYRTLSGGQFSMQVNGYLANQLNAAPPLLVEATHAVRDLRLSLGTAATGYIIQVDLLQNNLEYSQVILNPADAPGHDVVDGSSLPPLQEGALLSMNVALVPISGYNGTLNPGKDLTLTIRF